MEGSVLFRTVSALNILVRTQITDFIFTIEILQKKEIRPEQNVSLIVCNSGDYSSSAGAASTAGKVLKSDTTLYAKWEPVSGSN